MSIPSQEQEPPRVTTADLARRRSEVVVVDAHGPPYYANGHVPGAVNLPPHDVLRLAAERGGPTTTPVIVYGASGSSNAAIVADQLRALGYPDVSLYEDGLEGWIASGLPTEAADEDDRRRGSRAATTPQQILNPSSSRCRHEHRHKVHEVIANEPDARRSTRGWRTMTAEVLRYSAFSADGRGGNPAGVVLDAGALSDDQMLAIARAIGYSETAFVIPTSTDPEDHPPLGTDVADAAARIRYFSPVAEVAFCGHATVATAVALAERAGPGRLRLLTAAGPVAVVTRVEDGHLVATLTSPPTRTRPVAEDVLEEALAALRWTRDVLDRRYPSHVSFAGNRHLVVGVRDREALARLDYDYPRLGELMSREQWTTAHLFWSETATTFHVRNPFPPGGVVEDPATGAAAAAFGGYLRALGLVSVPGRVVLHQGHDLGRPSTLLVDLAPDADTVDVTGRATRLALSPYDEMEAL